jgi:hypothetical protein
MFQIDRRPAALGVAVLAIAGLAAPSLAADGELEPPLTPLWEVDWSAEGRGWGLAVDPVGNLWVSTALSTFDIYDPDGALLESWGEFGRAEGQFDFANQFGDWGDVAFRPDGGFYVADADNVRVQQFDPQRRFVREWGTFGTDDGEFQGPDSIALDDAGNVYVMDPASVPARVQVFDPDGMFLRAVPLDGPFFAVAADGTILNIDEGAMDLIAHRPDGTVEVLAELPDPMTFGTGILPLPSGSFLVASELDGDNFVGPEHLAHVAPDGEVHHLWPDGGWSMALAPEGDRFFIVSDKLRAYEVPE